jgi:hypothetical protein
MGGGPARQFEKRILSEPPPGYIDLPLLLMRMPVAGMPALRVLAVIIKLR